jgi:GntR family transcriptional regulator, transcriptional repressor for pyruvate dehydrogenase complex
MARPATAASTAASTAAPSAVPAAFELSRTERAPLSLTVSHKLRQAIVSGSVGSGTELPSEKDLVRELGVGRSTVREALRILQAQGLVSGGETVSTRRPRVSTEAVLSSAAAQAMENVLRLGQIPLGDLVELRVVIEGAAAEMAASAKEPNLVEARAAVEAMRAPGIGVEAFRAADLAFHRAIAQASGNIAFPLVMGVLRAAMGAHLGEALARERKPAATMAALADEHAAILKAIAAGRSKRARELLADHIEGFYRKGQTP